MKIKGICYDTGTGFTPKYFSRDKLTAKSTRKEIEMIRTELNCNAVRIYGDRIDRLILCSKIAFDNNLEVWISPRFVDKTEEETLKLTGECAKQAERLRKLNSELVLVIGNELTLDMKGLLSGETAQKRVQYLWQCKDRDTLELIEERLGNSNELLNQFLEKLVPYVRNFFKGKITYAASNWEQVNWDLFDIIGLNRYLPKSEEEKLIKELSKLKELGKPIAITEFGSESYAGVFDKGPGRCDPVDWKNFEIKEGFKRSEKEQADYIKYDLELFENEGIFATFVYTFIEPLYTYSENPKKDLDIGGCNVVRVYLDGHIEPKESFKVISNFYKNH
ncbi:hypothetical protein CH333_07740 [candidate division WOR-3 bacterium JGI_Cruoil_03_44_89]|uniref:Abortive infection protein n=1 Tax=candidate division WOR-3 bacterium JGI_Cruoil_03_44_89 TaxID=1973748 RepID=A0A235BQT5_UNCW3|nr:MAG: hypothetical protein CH333_07740 [candidate division WOR-3 bacterium JGI_Cruoil_03_44_89]